jgi:glyoxylase-like metal-dependent hydrolase (beta-lactamase superfamily II)
MTMERRLILERFEQPRWLSNTWLVAAEEGAPALLVDAGAELGPVLAAVRRNHLRLQWILLTHHHYDHAANARAFADRTGARVAAHPREIDLFADRATISKPTEDGQVLSCGDLEIRALHIPGHTAGQLGFQIDTVGLFTGDTLFRRSVGGTLAPGHTDFEDLKRSLLEKIMVFPDDTPVFPGHRLATTIGEERQENPFLRVLTGADPEGEAQATFAGRPVRLIVWARDYDDGHKAWVRFDGGRDDIVPGSRVRLQE